MGFPQHNHHHNAATDGVSQRVNSPRYSGPMTRRAQSFKRNNNTSSINNNQNSNSNSTHHEIDLQLNSPLSETNNNPASIDGFGSALEKRQKLHHNVLKRPIGLGLRGRKRWGHLMFSVFCGICLFLGVFKFCANGWFGSALERVRHHQVWSTLFSTSSFFFRFFSPFVTDLFQSLITVNVVFSVHYVGFSLDQSSIRVMENLK